MNQDVMNDRRANWAAAVIALYRALSGSDSESALPDLLGDLMHWCDCNRADFDNALYYARDYYKMEIKEAAEDRALEAVSK
jgi:hypothetical protein